MSLSQKFLESVRQSALHTRDTCIHVAVVGVAGMGGVGKTTALIGLAREPDIRKMFSDGGIHFMTVGKDTRPARVVASLKEIVRCSGGKKWSEKIDDNGSVESAVRTTSSWFRGRKALFILDDLWETSQNPLGYFKELWGLLDESTESHMLVSARSSTITSEAGTRIEFGPRENTGREARGIFLASAELDEAVICDSNCKALVEQVLEVCGGVPLMLSIAGAQVRGRRGTPVASLERLLHSLKVERLILLKARQGQYPSYFNQTVEESLKVMANVLETPGNFMDAWIENSGKTPRTCGVTVCDFVMDCFHRLCILPRSARVSEEVMFANWGNVNRSICWSVIDCLVNFHLLLEFEDVEGKSRFGVHDVILDYCKNASQSGGSAKHEQYHREFLNHAWEFCKREATMLPGTVTSDVWEEYDSAEDTFWDPEVCGRSRGWWKISPSEEPSGMEEYLLDNLFRHLEESSRLAEAVGLLSHMGWTKLRVAHGSIVALETDFSFVTNAIKVHPAKEDLTACDEELYGIKPIWEMVKRVWPVVLKNSEALPTHAYGYLLDNEKRLHLIDRYLQSAGDIVTGPWLKPKSPFWSRLDSSSDHQVFRTAEKIVDIAIVRNPKVIVAATKKMIFWIDSETMTTTGEMLISKEGHSNISTFTLCEEKGFIVIGYNTGELELRNEKNGNIIWKETNAHEDTVARVKVSAEEKTLVSGSHDCTIRLWDVESGSPICEPLRGHEDKVHCVGISADGRTVVSSSADKTVRMWNVENGAPIGEPLRGHNGPVYCVGISADGRIVVSGSGDETVRMWDVENGTAIGKPFRGHESVVWTLAVSADGRTVASASWDRTVRLWDIESETAIGEPLHVHDDMVHCMGMSADGRMIVSGSAVTVRLWDVEKRIPIRDTLHGHGGWIGCAAISVDGRLVATCSHDKTIRLWDAENERGMGMPLFGHEGPVCSTALSANGSVLVSGSVDKTVRIWDVKSGKAIGEPFRGHEKMVHCVRISADGRIVVSGSCDMTVRLWDTENKAAIGEPLVGHDDEVRCVAISANGRTVVSGSSDGTVRLWDVRSGKPICEPLLGHFKTVCCVGITPDGRTVVSGSEDKTIRFWDVESGAAIGESIRGHDMWVKSVAISTDGRTVMARYGDGTVLLWSGNASGTNWMRSYVCSLPISSGRCATFVDGDECSGAAGKLVCPLLGGVMVFDMVHPGDK